MRFLMSAALALMLAVESQMSGAESSSVALLYHHVSEDSPALTSISPAQFEAHLEHLEQNGFHVWPLSKLVAAIFGGRTDIPANVVAITFDDAYSDIYHEAFPRLKRRGWPFTLFVATRAVGLNASYLSWHQIREMIAAGAEVGNHTHNHDHLLRRRNAETRTDWLARVRADIVAARDLIKHHTGLELNLFAYPYGEYDQALADLVTDLGMTAFGQQSGALGPDLNRGFLPRFPMAGRHTDLESFQLKVRSLPLPAHVEYQDPLFTPDDQAPRLILRFASDHPGLRHLTCYGPKGRTTLTWPAPRTAMAHATEPLPTGRSRYNCTMPDLSGTRYHWHSQLWIRKHPDGTWYAEP